MARCQIQLIKHTQKLFKVSERKRFHALRAYMQISNHCKTLPKKGIFTIGGKYPKNGVLWS